MSATKTNGVPISTTATLPDQPRISVSDPSLFLSICFHSFHISVARKELELQVVHIYFDTSTFDRVEKDVKVILEDELISIICKSKVTLVAQLGLIGGTMGLFTGFSILSGIEILYFAAKFFLKRIEREISKYGRN